MCGIPSYAGCFLLSSNNSVWKAPSRHNYWNSLVLNRETLLENVILRIPFSTSADIFAKTYGSLLASSLFSPQISTKRKPLSKPQFVPALFWPRKRLKSGRDWKRRRPAIWRWSFVFQELPLFSPITSASQENQSLLMAFRICRVEWDEGIEEDWWMGSDIVCLWVIVYFIVICGTGAGVGAL